MKNNIFSKKRIFSLCLVFCLVIAIFAACGKKKTDTSVKPGGGGNVGKPETELIMGFDSWDEISGAALKLSHLFGRTEINTDKKFIRQGEGSWKVSPTGDYGNGDWPNIRMRFGTLDWGVSSTFKVVSLQQYDKIMMDVYNASNEDITVVWYFTAQNNSGTYTDTPQVECTLPAGKWTTVEYDLSGDSYDYFFRLSDMKFNNFIIRSKKQSKDDVAKDLYFDNMRGHFANSPHTNKELSRDFKSGITFEESAHTYLFSCPTESGWFNQVTLSRVAYADTALKNVPAEHGDWCLKASCSGMQYPAFQANFGSPVPAGSIITFMLYVEVDPGAAKGKTFTLASQKSYSDKQLHNVDGGSGLTFNEWHEISVHMNYEDDHLYVYADFGVNTNGLGLTDTPVNFYIDNYTLLDVPEADFEGGIGFENSSDRYFFSNPAAPINKLQLSIVPYSETSLKNVPSDHGRYVLRGETVSTMGYPAFQMNFGKTFPAGTVVKFMLYIEADPSKVGNKTVKIASQYSYSDKRAHEGLAAPPKFNRWTEISFRMNYADDHLYVYADLAALKFAEFPVNFYIDNVSANPGSGSLAATGSLDTGLTFEAAGHENHFRSDAASTLNSLVLSRVAYSKTGFKNVPASHGKYALKGESSGVLWPAFTLNFGKTYKAGTIISFKFYAEADPGIVNGKTFAVTCFDSVTGRKPHNVLAGKYLKFNEWTQVDISLAKDASSVWFYYNLAELKNGQYLSTSVIGDSNVSFYMDNFKAVNVAAANFEKGVTFENEGERYLFSSNDDRALLNVMRLSWAAYADTSLKNVPAKNGGYMLKGSTYGMRYPAFQANLGKTFEAGTVAEFDVYVEAAPGAVAGKTFGIASQKSYSDKNAHEVRTGGGLGFNAWVHVTVRMRYADSHLYIYFNFDSSNIGDTPVNFYIDNFKLSSPAEPEIPVGSFEDGITFEEPANAYYFESNASTADTLNYMELNRAAYSGSGIENVPSEYGGYALAGRTKGVKYPALTVKFDKAYPAGTTIEFWVYAKVNLPAGNWISFTCFDKNQGARQNVGSVGQDVNQWVKYTITLDRELSSVWGYFMVYSTTQGGGFEWPDATLYFDNFKITPPAAAASSEAENQSPVVTLIRIVVAWLKNFWERLIPLR